MSTRQTIANIREALKKSKRMCAIMLDTKGPEIRTGLLKDGKDVELKEGQVCPLACWLLLLCERECVCVGLACHECRWCRLIVEVEVQERLG